MVGVSFCSLLPQSLAMDMELWVSLMAYLICVTELEVLTLIITPSLYILYSTLVLFSQF